MRNSKVRTGHLGEAVAKSYFIQNGYEVYTADYHNSAADMVIMDHGTGKTTPIDVKVFKAKLAKTSNDIIFNGGGYQDAVMTANAERGVKSFICVEIDNVVMPVGWRSYSTVKGKWVVKYISDAKQTLIDKLSRKSES